ncbi:hypothetical protein [Acinetobacter sp. CFCC 10889]|uniref:hypothetical protein n=1 Tax=Acinetobacter sp. CFCC 10889 TaxID=1775557 RepID=UPI002244F564|nr:hypothetical protein [Acinetobacter sp. CFCC 10889]
MVKIREAYEILSDPIKRANYDNFLAEQRKRKEQQDNSIRQKEKEEFAHNNRTHPQSTSRPSSHKASNTNNESQTQPNKKNNVMTWTCSAILLCAITIVLMNLISKGNSSEEDYLAETGYETSSNDEALIAEDQIEEKNADEKVIIKPEQVAVENIATSNNVQEQTAAINNPITQVPTSSIPEFNINNDPSEIRDVVELTLDTFFKSGLLGLQGFVKACYTEGMKMNLCMYAEIASRYLHDNAVIEGHPELYFFTEKPVDDRFAKNLYYPYSFSNKEYQEYLTKTTQEVIQIMNTALADRGYS